jgi:hypothetical protein
MHEDRPDVYEYFGTYANHDARRLMDAFVDAEVDFTLDADKMGIGTMSAVEAAYGGTFGAGAGIAIGIHTDDVERAMALRQKVLNIVV